MKNFPKLILFMILLNSVISCASSKMNKKELKDKTENSEELQIRIKKISSFSTCKHFMTTDKRIFNQENIYQTLSGKPLDSIIKVKCIIASNYPEGVVFLIQKITDTTEVGLTNYFDINVWDRIENGDMVLDYGNMTHDDLFRISGRSNYLLKELTGQDFGFARMNSSVKELEGLQKKWMEWISSL